MSIIDTDRETVLLTNDDDDRDPTGENYGSFADWTCPRTGTYYIKVEGFGQDSIGAFNLGVTKTSGTAPGMNPCVTTPDMSRRFEGKMMQGLPMESQLMGVDRRIMQSLMNTARA